MAKSSINKVRNLKQKEETWDVIVRPARTWVESRNKDPYRPWYILVMSDDNKIVRHDMLQNNPTTHELSESIFRAMRRPMMGAGRKRRPTRILFDNEKLHNELSPILTGINIESEKRLSLPNANALLDDLDAKLGADENMKPMLSISGVTVPLMAKIFETAAAYYRLAPWERLPEEEFAIEIRYPVDAEARYAIVIGRAGESFGLSVNDTLDDLRQLISKAQSNAMFSGDYSVLSFTYEKAFHLSFKDLDAIEKYGWDIPDESAYPSILRFNPKTDIVLPNQKDMYWLEGALPALTDFFDKHFNANEFFMSFGKKEFERIIEVQTLSGMEKVSIKLPAKVYP